MLEKVLTYMIPVISIGLTYIFGRLHAVENDKKAAYREAYDAFYLPFINLLYQTQIWHIGFARLNLNDRHKLFDLIVCNIQYMDKDIIKYVDILYAHYAAILGKEMLDVDSIFTHDRADEIFDDLTMTVLSRATWLAKKLRQPRIGEFVQRLYLDEVKVREKRRVEV